MTLPDKLVALLVPQKNQILTITFRTKDPTARTVAQRRFKDGGEDPMLWCQQNWQDGYTWSVQATPYTPAQVTWADERKRKEK